MKMTMSNVVGNYLRWFELKRAKKAIGAVSSLADWPPSWRSSDKSSERKSSGANGGIAHRSEGLEGSSSGETAQSILRTDSPGQQ
jgi:hypothetical protein